MEFIQVVEIIDSSSEPEEITPTPSRPNHHPPSKRTVQLTSASHRQAIKKENKPKVEHAIPLTLSQTVHRSSPTSDEITNIPAFARIGWQTVFLPTLYDRMGSSDQPFSKFNKDARIVPVLQEVLNLSFPGTDYEVKWCDKICSQVRTHLLCL